MPVTYYLAMPFARNEEGELELVRSEAQDRQSASAGKGREVRIELPFNQAA